MSISSSLSDDITHAGLALSGSLVSDIAAEAATYDHFDGVDRKEAGKMYVKS